MSYRHELKFYINQHDYIELTSKLKKFIGFDKFADENGNYHIRSIYFDDFKETAYNEKQLGINNRFKYRIRFYNDNHNFIRLERKMKINGLCKKLSAKITKEECERLLVGNAEWLKSSTSPILKELYVDIKTNGYRPKTIVDYVREAYIYKPGNVRITIDKFIRSGMGSKAFFEKGLGLRTMDENLYVLEVKYDHYLPELIQNLIQLGERRQTSISKYILCKQYEK